MDEIRPVDLSRADLSTYKKQFTDCIILSYDNTLYMQKRPDNWHSHPGAVNFFGGHFGKNETPIQAVIRELYEETGAQVRESDLVLVGALTEGWTQHTEIVHVYFWHDKNNTITGCYEAQPIAFNTAEEAIAHPNIMDYAKWALKECQKRGLIA